MKFENQLEQQTESIYAELLAISPSVDIDFLINKEFRFHFTNTPAFLSQLFVLLYMHMHTLVWGKHFLCNPCNIWLIFTKTSKIWTCEL